MFLLCYCCSKFDTSVVASALTTVVMGLSLVVMAYFHRKWTAHILDNESKELVSGLVCL